MYRNNEQSKPYKLVGAIFTILGIILLVTVSRKRLNGGFNDVYSGNI